MVTEDTAVVRESDAAAPDRRPFRFTLLVWMVMSAATLVFVGFYGSNVPCWDDWDLVPTATGQQPVTLEWLWSQHNEHRVPVPRLVLLALLRLLPMDFRTGMFFNVLVTAGLTLALILVARKLRGRSIYPDAFFPIALLGWGQAVNFLWCWEVQFYSSMALSGAALVLMARSNSAPKLWLARLMGFCVILLPLCGANGLGLVPALAAWLGYAALVRWRTGSSEGRREAIILSGLGGAAIVLVALYFVGYSSVPYHPSNHHPRVVARTVAQFLTMAFGPGIVGLSFPDREPQAFWKLICGAVVALYVLTAGILLTTWWNQPKDRARTAGLLLFLLAIGSLALGLGMGRDGFETRYVTLSLPGICAIYLAWIVIGPVRVRRWVTLALFAAALGALPANTWWGWRYAQDLRSRLSSFEGDIRRGMPPYQVTQRHSYLHPHHILMMDYMPMLREAGVGAFAQLRSDPPFELIPVPLTPVETEDVMWQDGVARAAGKHETLTFALPQDVDAAGIRLRYTYQNPQGVEPYIAIHWKSSKEPAFGQDSYTKYSPTGDRANWRQGTWSRLHHAPIMEAWVCQPVQTIRIRPAIGKGTIEINELSILVPAADPGSR